MKDLNSQDNAIKFAEWIADNYVFNRVSHKGSYYWNSIDERKSKKYVDSTKELYDLFIEELNNKK